MSLLTKERSLSFRLREGERVVVEKFGPLHRPGTLLEWGSITKTVTATLAHLLADQGVVDLSAPVTRYLPDARLPQWVSVESLITHTSGLPSMPSDLRLRDGEWRDPFAKYTPAYFDEVTVPRLSLEHTGRIGTRAYSNLGYAVLTRLLERAAGEGWWDLVRKHVLAPCGVTDVATTADRSDRVPVLHNWAGQVRSTWVDTGPFIGAGGILSTFDELEKYMLAARRRHLPGGRPPGWEKSPTLWWHNGHNRDQGAFVGVDDAAQRVITVHTLGYRVGTADKVATRLERRFPV